VHPGRRTRPVLESTDLVTLNPAATYSPRLLRTKYHRR
jgi:hypothetical protein